MSAENLIAAEKDCWSLVGNLNNASKASKAGEALDAAELQRAITAAKDLTDAVEAIRYRAQTATATLAR